MDEAKRELVQSWLLKASDDLAVAQVLTQGENAFLEAAVYHCQQAAEKAVKAFLVFNDQDPQRTHDVDLLLDRAMLLEPNFAGSRTAGKRLSPYATLYRYPSRLPSPNLERVEEALHDAEAILSQVLACLPPDVHPDSKRSGPQ
jgi:HEPN domain-containing protein